MGLALQFAAQRAIALLVQGDTASNPEKTNARLLHVGVTCTQPHVGQHCPGRCRIVTTLQIL